MSIQQKSYIVTCGGGFIDIDGFACAIAYSELLRLEGKNATAVLTDPLNASVTAEIRSIAKNFSSKALSGDEYIIVDVSDPEIIQRFAPLDKITKLYDHHTGFEPYWKKKLGKRAKIEIIGAAATLIWEEFKVRGFAEKISQESAMLLAHAIVSNTVNFLVGFANERDRSALIELEKIAHLQDRWMSSYFLSQQKYIEQNPKEAILNDTKFFTFPNFGSTSFGQIEIWNSEEFLEVISVGDILLSQNSDSWLFNCIDIESGKNQILSNNPQMLKKISEAFNYQIINDRIHTNYPILRKEIVPILRNN